MLNLFNSWEDIVYSNTKNGRFLSVNKILACGLEGEAEYIMSGDRHLKDLKIFQGIKIMNPADINDTLERLLDTQTLSWLLLLLEIEIFCQPFCWLQQRFFLFINYDEFVKSRIHHVLGFKI